MNRLINVVARGASLVLIFLVRCYQTMINPALRAVFGVECRYTPSCSHYFIGAVEKYGPLRGALKGIARILRCHPWHPGGYDPP